MERWQGSILICGLLQGSQRLLRHSYVTGNRDGQHAWVDREHGIEGLRYTCATASVILQKTQSTLEYIPSFCLLCVSMID